MTTPTEPTPPQPDDAPATDASATEPVQPSTPESPAAPEAPEAPAAPDVPEPADAQPTEVYPPAGQPTYGAPGDAAAYGQAAPQPTEAYPPADAQPTEAYPPAGSPAYAQPAAPAGYGQATYGQAAYGQAPYGQPGGAVYGDPAYSAAPLSVADRPRGLGWASLGLAIGGLVLVCAAFIPLLWVSLVLALIGGLLLLVALVLGIVTLASKKQGGKGLGIGAIVVSVLGGILWVVALVFALAVIGLSVASSSSGASDPDVSVSEEAGPGDEESSGEEAPAGVYDEEAYLAAVRPTITEILLEIDPNFTEELVGQIYSDDMLIATGKALLAAGDAGRDAFISSTVESSDGLFAEEQALAFYDAVLTAAEQYLVE